MKCPNCNKQIQWQDNPFRPFCSERCKLVDLGKWVSEEYRVPGKPVPSEHTGEDDVTREESDETGAGAEY
jgi:endogenous inhibitor of DNA gyrase (YacG/DUF329 family)